MAIAKARSWVDKLVNGRVGSLAMLARREGTSHSSPTSSDACYFVAAG